MEEHLKKHLPTKKQLVALSSLSTISMKYILLLLLCSVVNANADVTIIVNKYPKGTQEIFVAGSFNQWNPSMKEYQNLSLPKAAGHNVS